MNNQNNIRSVLNNHKIIPVVTFTNKEDIQPIVESLLDQQIKCIEVTLRNSISRDAVEVIKNIYGDKIAVGVGTVLNKSDVLFSQENNVDFMVSPGATKNLINEFENSNFLPTKSDKSMISLLFSTVLNMRPYFFETIFSRGFWDMSLLLPLAPPKKFILCSGFDKIK